MDSNGDGIGDLGGHSPEARLSRVAWCGCHLDFADLSVADGGFRLRHEQLDRYRSDLRHPGGILLTDVHGRDMKLLLDYVPNHTSDRHLVHRCAGIAVEQATRLVYLAESESSGGPPNNWWANFGGDAWEWDEKTGQYYYHAFLKNTRSQLAQSASAARHARCAALLSI